MKHKFYETGDVDAPEQIKDHNGHVVLNCCSVCGQAEAELEDVCPGPPCECGPEDLHNYGPCGERCIAYQ